MRPVFISPEQQSIEIVPDYRRDRTLNTLILAWERLDCKRLRRILAKDVILYEQNSPPIIGVDNVIHCHTIWFDRMRACMGKTYAVDLIPFNLRDIDDFSLHVQDDISSNDFMFCFQMTFSDNKIAEIELWHNDFLRIVRKYENKINELNINN